MHDLLRNRNVRSNQDDCKIMEWSMNGFKLSFFTQQGRSHGVLSISDWLLNEAKELGIKGATVNVAQSGYGRDGVYHSAHFFEVGEQPLEIQMAVKVEECERLFSKIEEEKMQIFYMKIPIEFGITGAKE